jgi:phosphatidylglycerophosphatase C
VSPQQRFGAVLPSASVAAAGEHCLAVFDLDDTLVRGDSFLPFLLSYAWRHRRFWPLVIMPWILALYACRVLSDRSAKERLLVLFFGNEPLTRIAAHADLFCSRWVRSRLRPHVVRRLREHQDQGHRVVLLSASPDLYVPQMGALLGISEVVCTRVSCSGGLCRGLLDGPNCKGQNKVDMLQAYLGATTPLVRTYAYGDSRSDMLLLRWVNHGFLVGRRGMATVIATEQRRESPC